MAATSRSQGQGLVQGDLSVKIVKDFPVAYGPQGGHLPVLRKSAHLVHQSGFKHGFGAAVYAAVELFAGKGEAEPLNPERSGLARVGLVGGEFASGREGDLQGPDDPLPVGKIYGRPAFGVNQPKLFCQCSDSLLQCPFRQDSAQLLIGGRKVVQPVAERIGIQAGASGHHQDVMLLEKPGQQLHGLHLIETG